MDGDDYEGWLEGDLASALYVALDRLEELDPESRKEPWFKYLEKTLDKTLFKQTEVTVDSRWFLYGSTHEVTSIGFCQ